MKTEEIIEEVDYIFDDVSNLQDKVKSLAGIGLSQAVNPVLCDIVDVMHRLEMEDICEKLKKKVEEGRKDG